MTLSTLMKMMNFSKKDRKHYGKRRYCLLSAISPFPMIFSKGLYCRHIKNQELFGGVNKYVNCTYSSEAEICVSTIHISVPEIYFNSYMKMHQPSVPEIFVSTVQYLKYTSNSYQKCTCP